MKEIQVTLKEVKTLLKNADIPWLLTRYNEYSTPNDLDVLVHPTDFKNALSAFKKSGYTLLSHDHALGGRKPGMQMNCVKVDRIKVDLHQNFTWRKTEYLSQDVLWRSNRRIVDSVTVSTPSPTTDAFLIFINLLFEKTYISPGDFELVKKHLREINSNSEFVKQAKSYGWHMSFSRFSVWMSSLDRVSKGTVFLPVWLVFLTYLEKGLHDGKIDVVSFAYYLFFRIRALISGNLPYE